MQKNLTSPKDARELELFSSAASLSDMEIFIFPDLMYALVLANIMSPEIWKWREDPWFKGIEKKSAAYKTNRVKQYIMDHFVFNLDLETWGLTTKEKELERFKEFVDPAALAQSNALFGYGGDKYYYDVDIRRHFGLEKYDSDVIPYWKTETVEAMAAFRHKEGYACGAGECVSLSALYVAALFIVGRMPLDNIFMIATPLHSQNFIAEKDGLLTNNRRLVTKKMWYNGTELSAKARRSVEHERITIVSHISGIMHTFYKQATIDPERYAFFQKKFKEFLHADLTFEYFANFLYSRECYWDCFQYRHVRNGKECFIPLPCIFNTQHSSKNRFGNESRKALLEEIDSRCFSAAPYPGKILINQIEEYLETHSGLPFGQYAEYFNTHLAGCPCPNMENLFHELGRFLEIEPRLPAEKEKEYVPSAPLEIHPGQSREEICQYLRLKASERHPLALLSLYAWRDMEHTDWKPFIKAAVERNPVCRQGCQGLSVGQIQEILQNLPNESIYEGPRIAQPDEVWNFHRGDGIEKAFLFWNLFLERFPQAVSEWTVGPEVKVRFKTGPAGEAFLFEGVSGKGLKARFSL